MKQWLMIQNFAALNTLEKQVANRTPKGVEKQLDYILVNGKYLRCSKDAEANGMIHMGSDHRCVMVQFVITASKKEVSQKTHIEKKKVPTAESTWSQDGEK